MGRPEYLRQQAELSLRKLRVPRLDLLQLHRIDAQVPAADQFGELAALQAEGKVAALGLSEVSVAEIEEASRYFTVSTVQNRYNLDDESLVHQVVGDIVEAVKRAAQAGLTLSSHSGRGTGAGRRLRPC